ncbi:MAG: mechanosensitive ion channel [Gemmatimonadota bacterium]
MIQDLMNRASELVGGYVPNFLGALLILTVGWLVALILGAVVRGGLKRTSLDSRVARWLRRDESAKPLKIERYAGKAVYYLAMVFVLVAFFQALNLTLITEPLNALLTQVTEFAPRLLGAGLLLVLAWGVATVLRTIVAAALSVTGLDTKLSDRAGLREGESLPLSKTIGDAVYWLTFLLFLPAILGALSLEGLLAPVQGLTERLLAFLPNILAAGLIFAVGWFVARLVQRIVTNLLVAAGLDRLSDRVGLGTALGENQLSRLVGLIVYVLILVPVLISSLNALQLEAITTPASSMLGKMLDALPGLFAAGLLLTLAYFVGRLIAGLVTNLLNGAGFDNILSRLGLSSSAAVSGRSPSTLIGTLIMVGIMLFASIEAAAVLGFDVLAALLSEFVVFAGQVVLGIIIFGVGLYLANLAARAIEASGAGQSGMLALAARVAIVVLASAMALRQMGLANEIINLAFGMMLGSIAVALALAFGLGSREIAGEQMRGWVRSLNPSRKESKA